MYKDKPYSYAASRRQTPWYRRKRGLGGVLLTLVVLAYWLGLFSGSATVSHEKTTNEKSLTWLTKPSDPNVDWNERRERVKDAFALSWDGYEKYAWGLSDFY